MHGSDDPHLPIWTTRMSSCKKTGGGISNNPAVMPLPPGTMV
jgi:hypothetical protein